jgi:hypothetical protein
MSAQAGHVWGRRFSCRIPAVIPSITLIGLKSKGILTAIGAGDERPMGESADDGKVALGASLAAGLMAGEVALGGRAAWPSVRHR